MLVKLLPKGSEERIIMQPKDQPGVGCGCSTVFRGHAGPIRAFEIGAHCKAYISQTVFMWHPESNFSS
jgi:hypothetical protein